MTVIFRDYYYLHPKFESMLNKILLFTLFLAAAEILAQSNYAQLNNDYYHLVDRYQLLSDSGFSDLHTSFKPYRQDLIVKTLPPIDSSSSKSDVFNHRYLETENRFYIADSISQSDKAFLHTFYKYRNDAYSVSTEDFKLSINPMLYVGAGKEKGSESRLFINSRGIEIDGLIDNKVGFYASAVENQANFPSYALARTYGYGAVPGENFWKGFKENGVDFFTAKGYISVNATKHIGVQFGYDKNFIGNGYRSLILSDYSGNYTFLKLNTKVWKFQYTNLFAEMNADIISDRFNVPAGNVIYQKKFMALHHLSLNVSRRLNIGVFESVIYGRDNNSFDLNYMNPVIFYRAIEGNLGSDGNVIVGTDWNWNLTKGVSFYGQIIIDEFRLDRFKNRDGWWGEKYGAQAGIKYLNVAGINNLDIQGEINFVRPYTYTHRIKETSYSHYNQPLAHPYGANFRELVGISRYQPWPRVTITGKLILAQRGLDVLNGAIDYTGNTNWGGNILLPNTTREQETGNSIAQGVRSNMFMLDFLISYQFKHNLFVDLQVVMRDEKVELVSLSNKSTYSMLSLRWNMPTRTHNY